eukprot:365119-Chlamydomonas_euryale.AAC.7
MTVESPAASREDEVELAPLASGHASSSIGGGDGDGGSFVFISPSAMAAAPGGGRHGRRGGGGAEADNDASDSPPVGDPETQAMLGDPSELTSESTERSNVGESSGLVGTPRHSWLSGLWGKLRDGGTAPEQSYAQLSSSVDDDKDGEVAAAAGVSGLEDPGSKFSMLQFLRFCGSGYVRTPLHARPMCRPCAAHVNSNHQT